MAAGCSSAASTDTGSEPDETSAAEGAAQEAPSAQNAELTPVDLEQWRKNARESASKSEDISPLDSHCADLYPDSITQQVADYIGLDVWAVSVSGLISGPSQGCSADGVLHRVNLMAWDDEPRAAYTADDTFGESLTALMIDEQAAYLEEALSIYDELD